MRLTITLDPDVALLLERERRARGASVRNILNTALRAGLPGRTEAPPRRPFRTRTMSAGRLLLDFTDVSETLALLEGENHR